MSEKFPVIAAEKPCLISLIKGKKYAWCSCGLSQKQPFCDGSHKDTGMSPIVFKAEADEDVLLCACKQTRSGPYCDGAHNNLADTYVEATDEEVEAMKDSEYLRRPDGETGKTELDGGAYAITASQKDDQKVGNLSFQPVISAQDGAKHLSLHRLMVEAGTSKWIQYEGVDTVLFVFSGEGQVDIAGKIMDVTPETGVYIRPNEAFRLITQSSLVIFAAVCPGRESGSITDLNHTKFQEEFPQRLIGVDPAKATVMANRFFQILVDSEIGSNEVTQFIGEVPKSRAAMHKHLYEEAIVILTGEGFMWTGTKRTDVKAGDILFLPHRQSHSVECISETGMRLMGVFYPSGSPAINY